jgi:hypothetical protein
MSTQIADLRTENRRVITEFFVTKPDPNARALAIHAVNNSEQARTFDIILQSDDFGRQALGPHQVLPHSSIAEIWAIPPDLKHSRLSIVLEENGISDRELAVHLR